MKANGLDERCVLMFAVDRPPRPSVRPAFRFLLVLGFASLQSCRSAAEAPAPGTVSMAVEAAPKDPETEVPAQRGPVERKLVRDAELHIEVNAYEEVRGALDRIIEGTGGYLSQARVEHASGVVSRAELTVRVPADKLDGFLRECGALGSVQHENLRTRDITEQYYDSAARLTNSRKLEARLLQLLESKADSVSGLLEVERELARVREQIESVEGKLRVFDSQVALSEVQLRVTTRDVFAASQPPTLGEQVVRTFAGSVQALGILGRGLLLVGVALLPFAPFLLGAAYVGYRVLLVLSRLLAPPVRTASSPRVAPPAAPAP